MKHLCYRLDIVKVTQFPARLLYLISLRCSSSLFLPVQFFGGQAHWPNPFSVSERRYQIFLADFVRIVLVPLQGLCQGFHAVFRDQPPGGIPGRDARPCDRMARRFKEARALGDDDPPETVGALCIYDRTKLGADQSRGRCPAPEGGRARGTHAGAWRRAGAPAAGGPGPGDAQGEARPGAPFDLSLSRVAERLARPPEGRGPPRE